MQQIVIWVPSIFTCCMQLQVLRQLPSEREGNKFTIQMLKKLTNEVHEVIPNLCEDQTRIESPYPLKPCHLL